MKKCQYFWHTKNTEFMLIILGGGRAVSNAKLNPLG
jgi:uncharacterized cupin superfamily protein